MFEQEQHCSDRARDLETSLSGTVPRLQGTGKIHAQISGKYDCSWYGHKGGPNLRSISRSGVVILD